MPIINLTTTDERFDEIGQLRKGDVKPERGPGRDLKYFRFTSNDKKIVDIFEEAYTKQPTSINCFLPFDDLDANFSAFQELYSAGALKHRCDGEKVWKWINGRLTRTDEPCPTIGLPHGDQGKCKPTGRLKIWIPELLESGESGYVTVLTTSKKDIANLYGELLGIQGLTGRLTGIQMVLYRRPSMESTPGKNPDDPKRRIERWMLHIKIDPALIKVKMLAQHQQALLNASSVGELPAPMQQLPAPQNVIIDHSTGEIIEKPATPSETRNRLEREIVGGAYPNTNKDTYAGMDDYHPDYDDDEAESVIDQPPPAPPVDPKPKSYTPAQLSNMRRKIDALWIEEKKLGGDPPRIEMGLDLEALTGEQLTNLGIEIKGRIETIRQAK